MVELHIDKVEEWIWFVLTSVFREEHSLMAYIGTCKCIVQKLSHETIVCNKPVHKRVR